MAGEKNFNIKNGLSIGGTEVISSSGSYVGSISASALDESVDDRVAQLLTAGTGITLTYDDAANTLTIAGAAQYGDSDVLSYLGGGTFAGNIIPSADNTYDLGSSSRTWKDVYVGPGSLYVNGQQVISDDSGTIVFSADSNQNMSIQTSGSGDLELDATGSGVIALKGPVQIEDGNNITNSAGNNITFSNNIAVDQIVSRSADTNLVLSGNGNGVISLNDDVTISGSLTVSGTTTTVNSETINLADNTIALNSNFTSGSPTEDAGLSVTRGSSTAKTFLWDETNDKWTVGSETFVAGTFEGNLTGNVTGTVTSIANHDTGDLAEGSNLYFTDARADARITAALIDEDNMVSNSETRIPSQQSVKAYVDSQVASKDNTDEITEGSTNLYFTNARADARVQNAIDTDVNFGSASDTLVPSQLAVKTYVDAQVDTADALSELSGDSDDITEGSTNLFYTDARARASLSTNSGAGAYDSSTGAITIPSTTAHISEGSNLYFTNARADARVNALLPDTDSLTEGSSNLYFTDERVDDRVNALVTAGTGITSTYDDVNGTLTLATTITQYADSDARGSISVTDSGGDGSLAYNSSTGVITYTGPSASEVRSHISAGTGVSISSGEISIGQAVATTSNVQFGNLTLSGNLTVNGTTSTVDSTNTTISDALIELGSGNTGANSNDLGLVLERGSTGDNAFMGWDESADEFVVATTTATGASTGSLTLTDANFRASQISTSYASNSGGVARNIYQSTSAPTSGDGAVGDLWILYS